ncbi:hypothetical protein FF36_01873 [Frankia torreyi]|uniref:Uncharacterized protein n=1 Tax=Frankia torreyi TaxID=1856 RepID=A0A0D8BHD1_9ACTN|nr:MULTISPECIES: hypothetical protein [Frankia]KJE23688.1 hypothetical protein FF36_01873 [Frankia torreyi]KQM05700.1 hypothetical protein FF86_1014118 [Frankia sp. CpI1-P]
MAEIDNPVRGPATLRYWADALDPAGDLDEDTRTLLASRCRTKWMATVGRLGGQAGKGRRRTTAPEAPAAEAA